MSVPSGDSFPQIRGYSVLVLPPMSGSVAWYGDVEVASQANELFKPLLIAAVLYHQFWLKDGLLLRMRRPFD